MTTTKPKKKPASIAPSSHTFLLRDCECCFRAKVTGEWDRPYSPMASIYNKIDKAMKTAYHGMRTEDLDPDLKPGVILCYDESGDRPKEWRVKSKVFVTPESNEFVISGRLDALIKFDDGTWGVADFKTSDPIDSKTGEFKQGYFDTKKGVYRPGYAEGYSNQFLDYKICLETPAPISKGKGKSKILEEMPGKAITFLCLITMTPRALNLDNGDAPEMAVEINVIEVQASYDREVALLAELTRILDSPPAIDPECRHCRLREAEQPEPAPATPTASVVVEQASTAQAAELMSILA